MRLWKSSPNQADLSLSLSLSLSNASWLDTTYVLLFFLIYPSPQSYTDSYFAFAEETK